MCFYTYKEVQQKPFKLRYELQYSPLMSRTTMTHNLTDALLVVVVLVTPGVTMVTW